VKLTYPDRSFKANIKRAFDTRDTLEISIRGWRAQLLAKEVPFWLPVNEIGLIELDTWKGPSNLCGMFMMSLYTAHYMALSADYELKVALNGNHVILNYLPLESNAPNCRRKM